MVDDKDKKVYRDVEEGAMEWGDGEGVRWRMVLMVLSGI